MLECPFLSRQARSKPCQSFYETGSKRESRAFETPTSARVIGTPIFCHLEVEMSRERENPVAVSSFSRNLSFFHVCFSIQEWLSGWVVFCVQGTSIPRLGDNGDRTSAKLAMSHFCKYQHRTPHPVLSFTVHPKVFTTKADAFDNAKVDGDTEDVDPAMEAAEQKKKRMYALKAHLEHEFDAVSDGGGAEGRHIYFNSLVRRTQSR